jgi:hypothetical protein
LRPFSCASIAALLSSLGFLRNHPRPRGVVVFVRPPLAWRLHYLHVPHVTMSGFHDAAKAGLAFFQSDEK